MPRHSRIRREIPPRRDFLNENHSQYERDNLDFSYVGFSIGSMRPRGDKGARHFLAIRIDFARSCYAVMSTCDRSSPRWWGVNGSLFLLASAPG